MAEQKNEEVKVVERKPAARRKRSLQKRKPQAVSVPVTINQIMLEAVQQKDVTVLRELLAFQKELDAMEAEKAFNVAMAAFRAECPIVKKKTGGAQNQARTETLWKYADLADIELAIKPHLAKNGLSYTWDSKDIIREDKKPGKETICWVSHIMGHKASGTFTSSIDGGTSAMNTIQKEGSTIEYGRRWSLKLALGIVVADEDDDAVSAMDKKNGKATKKITKAQVTILEKAIGSGDMRLYEAVTTEYGATSLEEIPADKFNICKERIETYKKKKKALLDDKDKKDEQTNMELAK